MSRIHDALRRGPRAAHNPATTDGPSAHADTVLATLGYRAHSNRPRRVATFLLVVLAVGAYVAWARVRADEPATIASAGSKAPAYISKRLPTATPTSAGSEDPASISNGLERRDRERHLTVGRLFTGAIAKGAPEGAPYRTFQQLAKDPPAPASVRDDFELALYYQRAGELDRALLHYKAVLQRNELNVEAHNNLGLLYKDKGLLDEAAREFERALFIEPRYLRARNNLGVTRREQGRLDAAAAEFRAVLDADPRNVDAMVNLALVQKDAGQSADARVSLVSALTIDPRNAPAHYNLAVQYEQLGEAVRAVEHYRAFLQYAGPEYAGRTADVRRRIESLANRIK